MLCLRLSVCLSACDIVPAAKPFVGFSLSLLLNFFTDRCTVSVSFVKISSVTSHNLFNGVNEFLNVLAHLAAGLVAVGLEEILQCL
jgi:hypothetical protein